MSKLFSSIPISKPKRNKFNLSHQVKFTGEFGSLIPFLCEPVLPSDRFKIGSEHLIRFAPMVAPIMADIDVYVHYFFVPSRLLWSDWETFITGSKNGQKVDQDELPTYPVNYLSPTTVRSMAVHPAKFLQTGSLPDYLGFQTFSQNLNFPIDSNSAYPLDDMPFRAYAKIYDDYYRDENLVDPVFDNEWFEQGMVSPFGDIPSSELSSFISRRIVRKRAWKKDYFTSALPFSQKGDDVLLPLNGNASLIAKNIPLTNSGHSTQNGSLISYGKSVTNLNASNNNLGWFNEAGTKEGRLVSERSPSGGSTAGDNPTYVDASNFYIHSSDVSQLKVDLSSASASTIRELRRAFAAQRFLERRAVGGTRYTEQNFAMFGVKGKDGRLQRAEYLGGGKQPVVVSQVLQTSQTTEDNPLGTPAGNAHSFGGTFAFDKTFDEYGYVMGIMSVMPKADYIQGIPRKFLKFDPLDYYWPQFARIGEQEIQNQELNFEFYPINQDKNATAFGYTPRYAEYRFINNSIRGDFKESLKFWTLGRDFDSTPQLNQSFIECNPSDRIWSVPDSDFHHLWIQMQINFDSLRPLPKYGEAL